MVKKFENKGFLKMVVPVFRLGSYFVWYLCWFLWNFLVEKYVENLELTSQPSTTLTWMTAADH